jgi:hypothetical protein
MPFSAYQAVLETRLEKAIVAGGYAFFGKM